MTNKVSDAEHKKQLRKWTTSFSMTIVNMMQTNLHNSRATPVAVCHQADEVAAVLCWTHQSLSSRATPAVKRDLYTPECFTNKSVLSLIPQLSTTCYPQPQIGHLQLSINTCCQQPGCGKWQMSITGQTDWQTDGHQTVKYRVGKKRDLQTRGHNSVKS